MHWRDTCRIKSFAIPFDAKTYQSVIYVPFRSRDGMTVERDVYDSLGLWVEDGKPRRVKYKRRHK
jgi:hypothetical protein